MGYISFDSSTRGWFLFHQGTNLALYDGTAVRTLSSNLQPTNEWNSYIITYDGTDLISKGAQIQAQVDGTPGSNDMPGRLLFYTTADGSASCPITVLFEPVV